MHTVDAAVILKEFQELYTALKLQVTQRLLIDINWKINIYSIELYISSGHKYNNSAVLNNAFHMEGACKSCILKKTNTQIY